MRILTSLALACTAAFFAVPASAQDAALYAFPSKENYCPTGMQPVAMNGVICCGVPNQEMTYQQVMAHPTPRKRVRHVRSSRVCPEGQKGCY